MRSTRLGGILAAAALAVSMGVAGCSTSDRQSGDENSSDSASADSQMQSQGDSSVQVDREPTGDLPEISGPFGEVPEVVPVDAEPPSVITSVVLESTDKDGAVIGENDILTVNYAGYLWDGTPFDSSFSRGAPATFSLNAVIQGWKYGLAGTRVGDRVLLVIPPEYGYGEAGQGDIPPNSTLIFVVDILAVPGSDTAALKSAKLTGEALPDGLSVEGELGEEPSIVFEDGASAPDEQVTVVVAEGDGPVITASDTVIYNYVGTYWGTPDLVVSTWQEGPEVLPAGQSMFLGEHVGSRIAMVVPAEDAAQPAQVTVVDILAAYAP